MLSKDCAFAQFVMMQFQQVLTVFRYNAKANKQHTERKVMERRRREKLSLKRQNEALILGLFLFFSFLLSISSCATGISHFANLPYIHNNTLA